LSSSAVFQDSGKSVALNLLEDLNFYCIDNVPAALLDTVITELVATHDSVYDNLGGGCRCQEPVDRLEIVARSRT